MGESKRRNLNYHMYTIDILGQDHTYSAATIGLLANYSF